MADLKVKAGETTRVRFRAWNDTEKTDPMDLTGASARMQIRAKVRGELLFSGTSDDVIDVAGNEVVVLIGPEISDTWIRPDGKPYTSAVYDIEVVLASGDTRRLSQGGVEIDPNVTTDDP